MDLEARFAERCRKTLGAYHADTVAVINEHGVAGSTYDEVWLEINERLNADLDSKRGASDGALHSLGEFLRQIEAIQSFLENGQLATALSICLEMVRQAHQLRGQMILKEATKEKRTAKVQSDIKKRAKSESRKGDVLAFRAKHSRLTKSNCWTRWEKAHPRTKLSRTTFFKYLQDISE